MRTNSKLLVGSAVLLALLAACAPGPNPALHQPVAGGEPAGFLLGLWHGCIMWITFVVSLFKHDVTIYEVHNAGWTYDLGFLFGASFTHGSGVAGARRANRRWR